MITLEQATEIRRLASVWATARARKAAVHNGCGGPSETPAGATLKADMAEREFDNYLKTLMETP